MVIIGLALFVVAAIFGIDLADKNRFSTKDIHVFGESLGTSGTAHFFVIGAITGAALILGLVLLFAGLRRKGAKAVERRQQRKGAHRKQGELERLRAENADLRRRLETPDVARSDGASVGVPAETHD